MSTRPLRAATSTRARIRSRARALGVGLADRDRLLPTGLLLLCLAQVAVFTSDPGRWVGDLRFEQNHEPVRWAAGMWSIWDTGRGFGTFRADLWPAPTAFFAALRTIGLEPAAAQRAFHGTLIALAGTGTVALLRRWHPRISVLHLTAALVMMFSPYSLAFLLPSALYLSHALLPWVLYLIHRGVRRGETWRWSGALVLVVAAVGTTDRGGIVFVAVFSLVLVVHLVATDPEVDPASVAGWVWRTVVLAVPALAGPVLALVLSGEVTAQDLRETELVSVVNQASSWSESWRGLGFWLLYHRDASGWGRPQTLPYSVSVAAVVATFCLPVGALIGLVVSRYRERLVFGAILIVGLVLMVGNHPPDDPSPWGRALSWLYQEVFPARVLRNSYKAGTGVTLAVAVLVGMAVTEAVTVLRRRWSVAATAPGWPARLGERGLLVVAPTLAVVAAALVTQPFWTGGVYSDAPGYDTIPSYVTDAHRYLDANAGDGRSWFVPRAVRNGFRWGSVNDDVLDAFTTSPHLIDVPIHTSRPLNADILAAVERSLVDRRYEPGMALRFAERLGIDVLVLRNDLDWQTWGQPRPAAYDPLRADPDLELVATFGDPGQNTTDPGDTSVEAARERELPPVEIYRVGDGDGAGAMVTWTADDSPFLVSGDGEAVVSLAAGDLLGASTGIRFTGQMSTGDLTAALDAGAPLLITDTNRRQVEFITLAAQQSHTLAPGEGLDRDPYELFDVAGAETTASYGDAEALLGGGEVALSGATQPWHRPAQAVDGADGTSWQVGAFGDPVGERFRIELRGPREVSGISLEAVPAATTGGRDVTSVGIRFASGSSVRAELVDGRYELTFPPRREAWIELEIEAVAGAGSGPIGLSEIHLDGLDLRERLVVPDDVFLRADGDGELARALDGADVGYVFRRLIDEGPVDVERTVRRRFRAWTGTDLVASGHLRVGSDAAESLIAAVGATVPGATASGRLDDLAQFRGANTVDGDRSTAWVVEADRPATLRVSAEPTVVETVEVHTTVGAGFSPPSSVTVRAGGGETTITVPDRACPTQCARRLLVPFDRPVVADEVEVVLTAMADADAGGDGVPLLRVTEVELNGDPNRAETVGAAGRDCVDDLVRIDGVSVPIRITGAGADGFDPDGIFDDGVSFEGCGPVGIAPGWHELEAGDGVLLDDLTLLPPSFPSGVADASDREVIFEQTGPTTWQVSDPPAGGRLVLAQSWHPGWRATADGVDLGAPVAVDGFNTWELPDREIDRVRIGFAPQRWYLAALAVSGVGVMVAAVVVWRNPLTSGPGRRRSPAAAVVVEAAALAVLGWLPGRPPRRRRAVRTGDATAPFVVSATTGSGIAGWRAAGSGVAQPGNAGSGVARQTVRRLVPLLVPAVFGAAVGSWIGFGFGLSTVVVGRDRRSEWGWALGAPAIGLLVVAAAATVSEAPIGPGYFGGSFATDRPIAATCGMLAGVATVAVLVRIPARRADASPPKDAEPLAGDRNGG